MAMASRSGRVEAVADVPARLALGAAMLYHGLQKLRGEGPAQTAAMFEAMGLRPSRPMALAAGIAETFAGAAAVLGIATRPAALAVIATQAVAIWKVHAPKGYAVMSGGMEYNLALVAMATSLLMEPPRSLSLHRVARARTTPTRSLTSRWPWLEGLGIAASRARPSMMARALDVLH